MTRTPSSPRMHARLACAIAAAVAASAATVSVADDTNDWIRFRSDPAQRLFPALPRPRTAPPVASPAATWPVTNCNDDGAGSLRAAVAGATSGDAIDLTALTCSTITLTTGAIAVEMDDLTFEGPGRNLLAIDGNQLDRVLVHPYGGTLLVRGLTLRNGRISAENFDITGGGCVASAGYLVLDESTVHACSSVAVGSYGGGLYAYSLTMRDSTLSGNHSLGIHPDATTAAYGGGAFVYALQIEDSTITGNIADHDAAPWRRTYGTGGGIASVRGGSISGSTFDSNTVSGRGGGVATFTALTVSNSTFSGNLATAPAGSGPSAGLGGGLFVRRPAAFAIGNSTITANHAAISGGGVWFAANTSELWSTIVHGNDVDAGVADIEDPYDAVIGGHANLVGEAGALVALPGDTLHADPLLGPLASIGGPTRTHSVALASPAIDAGSNDDGLAYDQRGNPFTRVHGAAPDIGAYEWQGVPGGADTVAVPALSTLLAWVLAALTGLAGLAGLTRRSRRQS